MNRNLFVKKIGTVSSKIDEEYCRGVIRESLRNIPENQNQKGTMNTIIVMEELAELSQELSKAIRGKGDRMGLIEELADVYLGIKYVQEIFDIDDETLARAANVKLYRQNERNSFDNKENEIEM